MIVIVDYGLGNLHSVRSAFTQLGVECTVSSDPSKLLAAERIILPGVGSFGAASAALCKGQLREVIRECGLGQKKPILGICLGMQLLADEGDEDGPSPGLGLVPGKVKRLSPDGLAFRIPHIGFNVAHFVKSGSPLGAPFGGAADFYFIHSYQFVCHRQDDVAAWCDYGGKFVAAVRVHNIVGTQFHPEKSQTNGLALLKNFLKLVPEDPC